MWSTLSADKFNTFIFIVFSCKPDLYHRVVAWYGWCSNTLSIVLYTVYHSSVYTPEKYVLKWSYVLWVVCLFCLIKKENVKVF